MTKPPVDRRFAHLNRPTAEGPPLRRGGPLDPRIFAAQADQAMKTARPDRGAVKQVGRQLPDDPKLSLAKRMQRAMERVR